MLWPDLVIFEDFSPFLITYIMYMYFLCLWYLSLFNWSQAELVKSLPPLPTVVQIRADSVKFVKPLPPNHLCLWTSLSDSSSRNSWMDAFFKFFKKWNLSTHSSSNSSISRSSSCKKMEGKIKFFQVIWLLACQPDRPGVSSGCNTVCSGSQACRRESVGWIW